MDFALRCAWHHGTAAVRTHLDGTNSPDEVVRQTVYFAFDATRRRWRRRGLELQGVANLFLPCWADPATARAHAEEAATHEGVVLGAYCGKVSPDSRSAEAAERAFDGLFTEARRHNLDVDLHIDESNDPHCCALAPFCAALARARAAGYRGRVVLGHATSLALQGEQQRREILAELPSLGPLAVVANPLTNLGLMDRRGTNADVGSHIDASAPRTPQWRGLTLVQELRAAGVPVAAASDNVRDWWHAYGDYDCLAIFATTLALGHLDTAPSEGAWADLVTSAPADALGLGAAAGRLVVGAPADLVLFPSARRFSELLARPQGDRIVLRGGSVQASELPTYAELDDLVAERTLRAGQDELAVGRGCTVRA